ncbi:MAG: MATE family efflux transporter [Myxococcota bacterium]|nr:MATE family efflux transporter [Myxococcota bacterium]
METKQGAEGESAQGERSSQSLQSAPHEEEAVARWHAQSRREELPKLLRLAIPLTLSFVGQQLLTLVDTFVAGRIGVNALAATGTGGALFWLGSVAPLGVMLALDPLSSQAVGAGDQKRLWDACRGGLGYALLLATVTSILLVSLVSSFAPWASLFPWNQGEAGEAVRQYLFARTPAVFPFLCYITLRCHLQSQSVTAPILTATLLANLINFPLSCWLGGGAMLLGELGLPVISGGGYGVWGVGVASMIASLFECLVLLIWTVRISGRFPWPARFLWNEINRIGLPIGGALLSEGGIFSAATLIAGWWGVNAVGAHQITLQLASFTFTVCLGISSATAVRVGYWIGAGSLKGSRYAARSGLISGLLIMSCSALIFWSKGAPLAGILSADQEVCGLATELLMIAAAFQLFDALQVIAAGALRGAGWTTLPLYIATLSHWGIGLPVGLSLALAGELGIHGIWWGLVAGLAVAGLLMSYAFFRRLGENERQLQIR